MIKVLSFLSNENCFAGHMWPAGHRLSTTVVKRCTFSSN